MRYLIVIVLFILSSCVTSNYNTPFINSEETIELDFGMSMLEVEKNLNRPLFIAYGNKDEIIWVYEVRTIQVKSRRSISSTTQEVVPSKTSRDTKHADVIHKLALTFTDGKLTKWEPYNE